MAIEDTEVIRKMLAAFDAALGVDGAKGNLVEALIEFLARGLVTAATRRGDDIEDVVTLFEKRFRVRVAAILREG